MKYLLLTLILIQSNFVFAGSILDPIAAQNQPALGGEQHALFSGQNFKLWTALANFPCTQLSSIYTQTGNTLDVFVKVESGVCFDPIPPVMAAFANINGLDAGDYAINIYIVPIGDIFPPAPADYASYFTDTINIRVLQAQIIDSSSNWSLIVLMFGLFSVGFITIKRKKQCK